MKQPRKDRKVFIIDPANRRYIIRINTRRATFIPWPKDAKRSKAHLAHMAGFMQRLGYTVRTVAPIPKGAKDVSVEQAADLLGCGVNAIYDRISRDTIEHIVITPQYPAKRNQYRIPVSALAKG